MDWEGGCYVLFRRDFRGFLYCFHTTICNLETYASGPKVFGIYGLKPYQTCIGTLFKGRQNLYICKHSSSIQRFQGLIVSFSISKYSEPETLGGLLRKRRLENDLYAKELGKIIGVDECTILNWEKDRTAPSQRLILLLKEQLNIDPFKLVQFGAISERQKSIINLITERGQITRPECQEMLGIRKQYAQNDLFFLYKLGVLGRTLGKRKTATYFLLRNSRD